ncbi:MAG: amidohydrolase family protein, partial [Spirochaetales bacterium]
MLILQNVLAALAGEKDFQKVDVYIDGEKFSRIVRGGSLSEAGAFASRQRGAVMRNQTGSIPKGGELPGGKEVQRLDGSGLWMFPGGIDPHVHLDEPGFTHREDFFHGTAEAARGGITTIIDMPCTSLPPVVSSDALKQKLSVVSRRAVVDYGFYGGIHGGMSQEEIQRTVEELKKDVLGFKCYFLSGMKTFPAVQLFQFRQAIAQCAQAKRPLLLHAEDPEVVTEATKKLEEERSNRPLEWKDYYRSRPMEAEVRACKKAVQAAGGEAPWLHVVHVGTAAAIEILAQAGASSETCPHYLIFDEGDFETLGAALKTAPPVKSQNQKEFL